MLARLLSPRTRSKNGQLPFSRTVAPVKSVAALRIVRLPQLLTVPATSLMRKGLDPKLGVILKEQPTLRPLPPTAGAMRLPVRTSIAQSVMRCVISVVRPRNTATRSSITAVSAVTACNAVASIASTTGTAAMHNVSRCITAFSMAIKK